MAIRIDVNNSYQYGLSSAQSTKKIKDSPLFCHRTLTPSVPGSNPGSAAKNLSKMLRFFHSLYRYGVLIVVCHII